MDPKAVVRLLTPTCTRALEHAIGRCVSSRHDEVDIDHFLLALLEDPGSDLSVLLALHKVDPAPAREALGRALGELRSGNLGKPGLAVGLLALMEDAWLHLAPEHGERRIRSGAMVAALARAPDRYAKPALIEQLAGKIPALHAHWPNRIEASGEAKDARTEFSPPVARLPREVIVHKVEPGEALIDVARRFAVDLEDVARENRLEIHAHPSPGTELKLRVLREMAAAGLTTQRS